MDTPPHPAAISFSSFHFQLPMEMKELMLNTGSTSHHSIMKEKKKDIATPLPTLQT